MASKQPALTTSEVIKEFVRRIPHERVHMLHYFSGNASVGLVKPFVVELSELLSSLEQAEPGIAIEMIDRIAAIGGIGEVQFEGIIQILAELYVAGGALQTAGSGLDSQPLFCHEPRKSGGKNPEFEACSTGKWYAVEVKTPRLVAYSREREANEMQITARLPNLKALGPATLPRDNPVKDFLISADAKFADYRKYRSESTMILAIVWDDFVQESVSALLSPGSGLLTKNSFYRDENNRAIFFPNIDGVLLIRHQHQLIRATREEPILDGQTAFQYHGPPFPPKALILNPAGNVVPPEVIAALQATSIKALSNFAEYNPPDLIMWLNTDEGGNPEA